MSLAANQMVLPEEGIEKEEGKYNGRLSGCQYGPRRRALTNSGPCSTIGPEKKHRGWRIAHHDDLSIVRHRPFHKC